MKFKLLKAQENMTTKLIPYPPPPPFLLPLGLESFKFSLFSYCWFAGDVTAAMLVKNKF